MTSLREWYAHHLTTGAAVFCGLVSVPVGVAVATRGGAIVGFATFLACWLVGTVLMVRIDSRRLPPQADQGRSD